MIEKCNSIFPIQLHSKQSLPLPIGCYNIYIYKVQPMLWLPSCSKLHTDEGGNWPSVNYIIGVFNIN